MFCAYNGSQNIASSLDILDVNKLDGGIALGILYSCFTLTCFVAPVVVNAVGAKNCVCIQFCFLSLYALSYLYPRWYTLYISAALVGIGAGPMWVSQGLYMSALSTRYRSLLVKHGNLHDLQEDYSGLFQGYFFGIFQLTQVFGNLVSGYIEHVANVKTLFLVYFGMIIFGILLLLYVPKLKEFKDSSSSDVVKNVISNIEQIQASYQDENENDTQTRNPFDMDSASAREDQQDGADLWTTVSVLKNKRVLFILPAFFAAGLEQSVMFGDVTTYIKRTFGHANIGYIMAIFGAGDAIASAIVGKLSDVFGKKVFLILACLIQGGCCTYFFVFKGSGITFLLMSVIAFAWGVADGIWNSCGSALCADTFEDATQRRGLFSVFRLMQSVAMMAYFVKPGATSFIPKLIFLAAVLGVSLLGIIRFKRR